MPSVGNSVKPLITERDRRDVTWQMASRRFDVRALQGVACRCRWGFPQVTLCRPLLSGRPFPTTFWLVCPYLVWRCSEVESHGGVKALESFLEFRSADWQSYQKLYIKHRLALLSTAQKAFLRQYEPMLWRSLVQKGVGGIGATEKPTVKCLHLQTGAWLGIGKHPGEKWLQNTFQCLECNNQRCLSARKLENKKELDL